MDFIEVVNKRMSIRAFDKEKNKKISDEVILELLELAIKAPSAGNLQSWEFIIVKDQETKNRLARAALNQRFVAEGSHLIVACANQELSATVYGNRGWDLYSIQDVTAAIMILLLGVTNIGLGACWVGAFREPEVREILGIPQGVKPVALIPIGYPKKVAEKSPPRKNLKYKLHFEKY